MWVRSAGHIVRLRARAVDHRDASLRKLRDPRGRRREQVRERTGSLDRPHDDLVAIVRARRLSDRGRGIGDAGGEPVRDAVRREQLARLTRARKG